jgi:hypothetical protein
MKEGNKRNRMDNWKPDYSSLKRREKKEGKKTPGIFLVGFFHSLEREVGEVEKDHVKHYDVG